MSIYFHDGFEMGGADTWSSPIKLTWKKLLWTKIKAFYFNLIYWRGFYLNGDKFRRRCGNWYILTNGIWKLCKPYNIPVRQPQHNEGIWIA